MYETTVVFIVASLICWKPIVSRGELSDCRFEKSFPLRRTLSPSSLNNILLGLMLDT